jgi:hypothetical protein
MACRAERHFPYPLQGILGNAVVIVAVVEYCQIYVVESICSLGDIVFPPMGDD